MSAQPHSDEVEAAVAATGYRYTDPVHDEQWPRITAPDDADGCANDRFPDDWGSTPTERDQAAIDAGNA